MQRGGGELHGRSFAPASLCCPIMLVGALTPSPVPIVMLWGHGALSRAAGRQSWREPAKQSWVLIHHRSHATTFCSGCCPTFQSHTFASDFNGLHHSPKLYLTKRGGSREAAARNQSNPVPETTTSSEFLVADGLRGGVLCQVDPRPVPDGRVLQVMVTAL